MRSRRSSSLWLSSSFAVACASTEPPPEVPRAVDVAPAPAPVVVEPLPLPPALPDATSPEPEEPEPLPTAADIIAPAAPDTVEIVETKAIGNDDLVLYRLDVLQLREAERPGVCERYNAKEKACPAGSSECHDAAGDEYEAWGCNEIESAYSWEIARVRMRDDNPIVLAHAVVWGPTLDPGSDAPATPVKFKVYDIDHDKRSEVMLIVPVAVPGEMQLHIGEIGAIFDISDLHLQFAATRSEEMRYEDIFQSWQTAKTVWVAKDIDADGHADLTLTQTTHAGEENHCDVDCDENPPPPERPVTTKQICPYDVTADRWACPSPQLGLQLLATGS